MTSLDAPLRSAALRLIAKFGKTMLFRTGEQRTYDTTMGGPKGTYDDEFEAKALIGDVDQDRGEQLLQEEREAGGVRRALKLTVADSALGGRTPTENWSVVLDHLDQEAAKAYRVARMKPIYSGDQVAIWELTVRR